MRETVPRRAGPVKRYDRLRELDLARFETIDQLTIDDNPVLEQLEHSRLAGVNFLEVSGNPLLDAAEFDGLGTVTKTVAFNKAPIGE